MELSYRIVGDARLREPGGAYSSESTRDQNAALKRARKILTVRAAA
jgi:hypothetical protein